MTNAPSHRQSKLDATEPIGVPALGASELTGEPPACVPGRVYSDYLVEELLATGGVAEIYRARHVIMRRQVAFKVLRRRLRHRDDVVRRMELEARALAEVRHPNVVEIYDAGTDPDVGLYIVMALLCGPSLRALMHRSGPLRIEDAVAIAVALAEATAALHALGIYHRDIKPENVLVEPQGGGPFGLKLLDLGAAKVPKYEARVTLSGHVFGTARYMSPEHARGEATTAAADQYALAVILYEMLLGRHPCDRAGGHEASPAECVAWHFDGHPTPLPHLVPAVGPALWRVIERALARGPADRFADTHELARALRQAQHEDAQIGVPSVSAESAAWLATFDDAGAELAPASVGASLTVSSALSRLVLEELGPHAPSAPDLPAPAPPAPPSPDGARPPGADGAGPPGRDGARPPIAAIDATLPVDDGISLAPALRASLTAAAPAPRAPLPSLSLEQYASLHAELRVWPGETAAIFTRYHLADRTALFALDECWGRRFAAEAAVRERFEARLAEFVAWLGTAGRM